MSTTFHPDVAALRKELEGYGMELAEMRGSVNQLSQIVNASVRQSVWQLIALIISLAQVSKAGFCAVLTTIQVREGLF